MRSTSGSNGTSRCNCLRCPPPEHTARMVRATSILLRMGARARQLQLCWVAELGEDLAPSHCFFHLQLDPVVCTRESAFQRNRGLPVQRFPKPVVIRVPPTHTLWTFNVVLFDLNPRDAGHRVRQVVD